MYETLTPEALKPTLLTIIKSKLSGEAYNKMQPLTDYATWEALKTALKKKLRKPLSYEYANEQLASVFQKPDESIENFGDRARKLLIQLNEASRTVSEVQAEKLAYKKTHEKLAISKFAQNIKDPNIKTLVMAANKTTLEECITFAMEKELCEKNSNIKPSPKAIPCTFHKNSNHTESECRRNKSNEQQPSAGNQTRPSSFTPRTNTSSRSYRALQPLTNQQSRPIRGNYQPRPIYNTYQQRSAYNAYQQRPQIPNLQFQRLNLNESYQNRQPNERASNNNYQRPYSQNQSMQRPSFSKNSREPNSNSNNRNNAYEQRANVNPANDGQNRQVRPITKEPSVENLANILERQKTKN